MKKRTKYLSVVLAVHNEEQNLDACLSAIQNLADEIIVVDGQSVDQTVAIAQKYRAKIIKTTNKRNFHINKQIAIDNANGKLILQLDADEVVDRQLHQFIAKLKTKAPSLARLDHGNLPVAWYLKRKNLFLGKYLTKGGQYPDPVIRLFYRNKAKLPQQSVHEQMVVNGTIATAPGHLLHQSTPTWADYWRKFQTYTDFTAHSLMESAQSPSGLDYAIIKPTAVFFQIFIRHKGFVDGWRGGLFALMSGLHYPFAWYKYLKLKR